MTRATTKGAIVTLALALVLLSQCSSPAPSDCDACDAGAVMCAGGMLSTCQTVKGCLEFAQPSPCPSGVCQDDATCAPTVNCASFTTCDTCTAPMTPDCFWCPTTSSCVMTVDMTCPGSIGGDDSALLCNEASSCLPCVVSSLALCDDTEFECTCTTGKTPSDKACVLDTGEEYCCSS